MHSLTDHPWLRRDTFFSDSGTGLQLANGETGFEVGGASAYRLFRTIHPFLDGSWSVEELRNAAGDNWPLMEDFLTPLSEHGFVRWIPASDFDLLSEADRDEHSDQVAYLAQFTDHPHAAFKAFAASRILIVGDSPLANSLVTNLVDNGAGAVQAGGEVGRCDVRVADEGANDVGDGSRYDLVVLDPDSLHLLRQFDPDLVLAIVAQDGYLQALTHPWEKSDDLTWIDGMTSLRRFQPPRSREQMITALIESSAGASQRLRAEPIQRMFGALLAYEIFKGMTGAIIAETGGSVLMLDGMTGETTTHRVCPAPVWNQPQHGQTPSPVSRPWDLSSSRAKEYDATWAPLVDRMTLPAQEFVDLELEQVPVRVSALRTGHGVIRTASLWTTADARIEAVARVYEEYCTSLLPPVGSREGWLGVDRELDAAALRAVRSAAREQALSAEQATGTRCELEDTSRAADFIRVTAPHMKYADLGEYGGWRIGLAYDGQRWVAAAAPELSESLISAAVEVLGAVQTEVPIGEGDPERFLGAAMPQQGFLTVRQLSNDFADALGLSVAEARWSDVS